MISIRVAVAIFLQTAFVLLVSGVAVPSAAQTLASQYDRFLSNKCAQLAFARDSTGQITAGQAVGSLRAFCTGSPSPADPSFEIKNGGWHDLFFSTGPRLAERTSTMPGWRNRTIQHRQTRRASVSGRSSSEAVVDNAVFLAMRPAVESIDDGEFERSNASVRAAVLLGGSRWINDEMLLTATAGYREHGYAVSASAVWTPVARMSVEAIVAYDRTSQTVGRDVRVEGAFDSAASGIDANVDDVRANPLIKSYSSEVYVGYDASIGPLVVGPRLGIEYRTTDQSSYTERMGANIIGIEPVALTFDAATQNSLSHRIGLNIGFISVSRRAITPQLELAWLYEYLNLERVVAAQFAEDVRANPVRFMFAGERRPRSTYAGRLGFGINVAPRFTVVVTGELRYDGYYGKQASGIVGVRYRL